MDNTFDCCWSKKTDSKVSLLIKMQLTSATVRSLHKVSTSERSIDDLRGRSLWVLICFLCYAGENRDRHKNFQRVIP